MSSVKILRPIPKRPVPKVVYSDQNNSTIQQKTKRDNSHSLLRSLTSSPYIPLGKNIRNLQNSFMKEFTRQMQPKSKLVSSNISKDGVKKAVKLLRDNNLGKFVNICKKEELNTHCLSIMKKKDFINTFYHITNAEINKIKGCLKPPKIPNRKIPTKLKK
jgi:hypothetical protein